MVGHHVTFSDDVLAIDIEFSGRVPAEQAGALLGENGELTRLAEAELKKVGWLSPEGKKLVQHTGTLQFDPDPKHWKLIFKKEEVLPHSLH